ncbi:MAG: 30S ribosomal protein S12 methylthiotransferase RimO, partial [Candidatus Omnitrophica bacterium]|nr:30S ribosomal protein S12 methylthiotransferase RimO [Candidatus Omnitrophota bacterium]
MSVQTLQKSSKWRVGMLSLGCPKTLVDSEVVLGKLDPRKYSVTPTVTDCDIALINTCAFIEDAQKESVDQILRLLELKRGG